LRHFRHRPISEGQRLAESFIKQVTGGDTITARRLYAEPFQFKPECKLILATNHAPEVRGTDHAIWRRIKLVPFNVTIPEEERDKQLADKLRAELSGILRWAVEGCLEWQREGLAYPEAVKDATAKYRDDMDAIKDFLEERCEEKPYERIEKGLLYGEYTTWCKANGVQALRKPDFGNRLKKRGIQEMKSGKHYWVGLEFRTGDLVSALGAPDMGLMAMVKNPGETPS
jgi:putative DNA primase/helicase